MADPPLAGFPIPERDLVHIGVLGIAQVHRRPSVRVLGRLLPLAVQGTSTIAWPAVLRRIWAHCDAGSAPGGVALHAPGAGGGLEEAVGARGGGDVAEGVVIEDGDAMPTFAERGDGFLAEAALDREVAEAGLARIE